MLSKSQEKHIRSLQLLKFRKEHHQFIAEGDKVVCDLLDTGMKALTIVALPAWIEAQESSGRIFSTRPEPCDAQQLARISALKTAQMVVGVFRIPGPVTSSEPVPEDLVLYLDSIRDPGNLGTILRIADWFGIPLLLLSPDCADLYNPKVVQASMGSLGRVQTREMDIEELQRLSSSRPLIGTTLQGKNLYNTDLPANAILVIGNEANGIRQEIFEFLNLEVTIPPFGNSDGDGAESLNAAVATAILCAEIRRRAAM